MEVYKTLAITSSVLAVVLINNVLCLTEEEDKKSTKCLEQCGGMDEYVKSIWNGEWECFTSASGEKEFGNPCGIKCMGIKPDEDKSNCFCSYCKSVKQNAAMFCTGPGEGPLKEEDCDSVVCAGKAQFRGGGCNNSKM